MIFNSIRWRLQIWHGLILLVVLTGFGFTAYHVARDNQLRRIDQELEQRLWMTFRMPPPEPPKQGGPRGGGPPPNEGRPGHPGNRNDPARFRERLIESVQRVASTEEGQTNSYYFVMWQCEGAVLATSTNTPPDISMPQRVEALPRSSPTGPERPPENANAPGGPAKFAGL